MNKSYVARTPHPKASNHMYMSSVKGFEEESFHSAVSFTSL